MSNIIDSIKIFATDVDGVLTDSVYTYSHEGHISKNFNTRDFYALNFIDKQLKIPVIGITGADDAATLTRFKSANIPILYGVCDKLEAVKKLLYKMNISFDEIVFVGDHLIDLSVIKLAKISFCPADALPPVLAACTHVSKLNGGRGVIDDFLWQVCPDIYEKSVK
jgi:3-deoxy-D-manno-octulosonate 8-phosphate phosphatase (KDO 8-P phosphatase)